MERPQLAPRGMGSSGLCIFLSLLVTYQEATAIRVTRKVALEMSWMKRTRGRLKAEESQVARCRMGMKFSGRDFV